MDVHFVSDDGIQQHPVGELEQLLARDDGLVWVNIPVCDQEAARVLREVFGFHPLAVQAYVERNAVPKVRAYRDHIFVILHAPELGTGGHVHYVELDQFIGPRYVVTVHGPVNPAVTEEAALRETHALLAVSNMAALGHQIYQRMSALGRFIPPDCQPLVADLEDQFARVAGVADGQIRYLEGVIEFYKARTDTKVTIAAERLALIAVLT